MTAISRQAKRSGTQSQKPPTSRVYLSCLAIVIALLASGAVAAQSPDTERIAPKPVPHETAGKIIQPAVSHRSADTDRNRVLVDALKGIIFLDDPSQVKKQPVNATGIVLEGLNKINKSDFTRAFQTYVGRPLTLALLDEINRRVVRYFRTRGYPVVDSIAPEGQDISNGVVQIAVLIGKLGKVRVEGERYFSARELSRQIRLEPGDELSKKVMQEDLQWLNNNPFRTVDLLLQRGKSFGRTDIVLKVKDRFPLRVYSGVDNAGTPLTGRSRWFTGFNWGNVFGLDQQFGMQFTHSVDGHKLKAWSFDYIAPLASRQTITLLGTHVDAEPPTNAAGFELKGKSRQLSVRDDIPLPARGSFNRALNLGIDYKHSNNNLEFGTFQVFNTYTDIVQFDLGYNAQRRSTGVDEAFSGTLTLSPGSLTVDNRDASFDVSRARAKARYAYVRFGMSRATRLSHDFSWATELHLQLSTGNLLGSEQMGLGGYGTVRGYDEYAAVGDDGLVWRNELRTPASSLLHKLNAAGLHDSLQALAFVDYGMVRNVHRLPGEHSTSLMSVGVGLRYTIDPYVTFRADYGWRLKEIAAGTGKGGQVHFSLVIGSN